LFYYPQYFGTRGHGASTSQSCQRAIHPRRVDINLVNVRGGEDFCFSTEKQRQGELWPQETVAVLSGLSVAGLRLCLLCYPVAAKMDCVHRSQQVDSGFASGICARRRGGYMGAFSGFQ
jgi:hypothetical protein